MSIIYSEAYYDSHKKEYRTVLTCDTEDPYIISLCNRYVRKPLSSFQNFDDYNHCLCSYIFKDVYNCNTYMKVEDLPQLLLLLSRLYDFDYKLSKLLEKHSVNNLGRKFICLLHKKN